MTRSISGRISHFYRLALENNYDNSKKAKYEIDAIPFHLGANNINAAYNHRYCPCDNTTWCNYQKAVLDELPMPASPSYLSV